MEIARHWRLNNQRYKLEGSICEECNTINFPPRVVCEVCISESEGVIYKTELKDNFISGTSTKAESSTYAK